MSTRKLERTESRLSHAGRQTILSAVVGAIAAVVALGIATRRHTPPAEEAVPTWTP